MRLRLGYPHGGNVTVIVSTIVRGERLSVARSVPAEWTLKQNRPARKFLAEIVRDMRRQLLEKG